MLQSWPIQWSVSTSHKEPLNTTNNKTCFNNQTINICHILLYMVHEPKLMSIHEALTWICLLPMEDYKVVPVSGTMYLLYTISCVQKALSYTSRYTGDRISPLTVISTSTQILAHRLVNVCDLILNLSIRDDNFDTSIGNTSQNICASWKQYIHDLLVIYSILFWTKVIVHLILHSLNEAIYILFCIWLL